MRLKKTVSFCLCLALMLSSLVFSAGAAGERAKDVQETGLNLDCRSAILMEAQTGKVLYEQNADEALPPASVTKVMTLLLVMEEIDSGRLSLDDTVTASAHACSMGGSQIFLKEGEQMSVRDMLKSVVIASANDAALALAEHIAGTEEAFVALMNKRAGELGLGSTRFENTNGLDDTVQEHVSSARDIAVMSRELIKHKQILEYSSTWMDTVRNGEFGLTNTNRLVRFYKGATGLKTGSTAKAKFCVSATAERDSMSLICVIMAAPTRDIRNAAAATLLDWGFANYAVYKSEAVRLEPIRVLGGTKRVCEISVPEHCSVVRKSDLAKISASYEPAESLSAPIKTGDKVGKGVYKIGEEVVFEVDIVAAESVPKIGFFGFMLRMLAKMSLC